MTPVSSPAKLFSLLVDTFENIHPFKREPRNIGTGIPQAFSEVETSHSISSSEAWIGAPVSSPSKLFNRHLRQHSSLHVRAVKFWNRHLTFLVSTPSRVRYNREGLNCFLTSLCALRLHHPSPSQPLPQATILTFFVCVVPKYM